MHTAGLQPAICISQCSGTGIQHSAAGAHGGSYYLPDTNCVHHSPPQAFAAALAALSLTLPRLLANQALLSTILNYHIILSGVLPNTTALAAAGTATTRMSGGTLTLGGRCVTDKWVPHLLCSG